MSDAGPVGPVSVYGMGSGQPRPVGPLVDPHPLLGWKVLVGRRSGWGGVGRGRDGVGGVEGVEGVKGVGAVGDDHLAFPLMPRRCVSSRECSITASSTTLLASASFRDSTARLSTRVTCRARFETHQNKPMERSSSSNWGGTWVWLVRIHTAEAGLLSSRRKQGTSRS